MWCPHPNLKSSITTPSFPAEGAGNQTFDNLHLAATIFGVPAIITFGLRLSFWPVYPALIAVLAVPLFAAFLLLHSQYASPFNNYVTLPGRRIEEYLDIKDEEMKKLYYGSKKVSVEIIHSTALLPVHN